MSNEQITDKCVDWRDLNILPQFTGYDNDLLQQESKIIAVDLVRKGAPFQPKKKNSTDVHYGLGKKADITVVIDPCPFYGLGGGQSPHTGKLTLENGNEYNVIDVFQPYEGGIALRLSPAENLENIEPRLLEDLEYLQVTQLDTHVNPWRS